MTPVSAEPAVPAPRTHFGAPPPLRNIRDKEGSDHSQYLVLTCGLSYSTWIMGRPLPFPFP